MLALGMSSDDLEFRPLQRGDVKAFKMYSADEELAILREGRRAGLGKSRKAPSWLWERWDFIQSSSAPEFKTYFEEGELES